jgi:competence transcription factor ComK
LDFAYVLAVNIVLLAVLFYIMCLVARSCSNTQLFVFVNVLRSTPTNHITHDGHPSFLLQPRFQTYINVDDTRNSWDPIIPYKSPTIEVIDSSKPQPVPFPT